MSKGFGNIVNIIFVIVAVSLLLLAYYDYDQGKDYMENLQLAGGVIALLAARIFLTKKTNKRDNDKGGMFRK
ncbi:hypothetical protein [Flammeovirga kamogawensis]|uniref:Uncharacterized protein n=1 Tax=Flammeovirga kamogawensis TaxID=373891 RepID=A0ABX8GSE6_9BACT|nr:hypothetical protein [Flammeovirga kamogawensis]MBB6463804.1 hypothetical protein [Flammeovirga kamogawensis]QWG06177.1 hypothetical protein KM029_12590 [Flammeovirga kamogawensis]TRX68008.1 hypothetical protein EO216_07610 [Flammeovirga kamogawensis]